MFQRITVRTLPNGELATVYPFHVCTKGQEDRVIFRDEEDLKLASNFIPICAHRANVIVFMNCVLNTHIHAGILSRNYEDAARFMHMYKISCSLFIAGKYGKGKEMEVFRRISSKPILLEDNRHVKNTICYIAKNALDVGARVSDYKWSSYQALFCDGAINSKVQPVSNLTYRQVRELLRTSSVPRNTKWLINEEGIIEPASYCDFKYAEEAFGNDYKYFLKVLGFTDYEQLEQTLAVIPNRKNSTEELSKIISESSLKMYNTTISDLTFHQKIPLIKKIYYSTCSTPKQLARCFGATLEQIEFALGRQKH